MPRPNVKIIKTIIFIFIYCSSLGQDTTMFLHSWKKPKKVDEITNSIFFDINLNLQDSNYINKAKPTSYSGKLLFILSDKIVIKIESEELITKMSNGITIRSSNTFELEDSSSNKFVVNSEYLDRRRSIKSLKKASASPYFSDSLKKITRNDIRTINIKDINSISYVDPRLFSAIGGGVAVTSVIAALLMAPLVSINYKTGDFNQKAYYSALATCGTGFTIGLSLHFIFRKHKSYKIKNTAPEPFDKNYYSVQAK